MTITDPAVDVDADQARIARHASARSDALSALRDVKKAIHWLPAAGRSDRHPVINAWHRLEAAIANHPAVPADQSVAPEPAG